MEDTRRQPGGLSEITPPTGCLGGNGEMGEKACGVGSEGKQVEEEYSVLLFKGEVRGERCSGSDPRVGVVWGLMVGETVGTVISTP